MAEFFLYMKTLENYCAPKHKPWKMFLCLGQEKRHSKMKVIISLGSYSNGAIPASQFFPVCFGPTTVCFPYYGPPQYYQNQPWWHMFNSLFYLLTKPTVLTTCCSGKSGTTPSSWEKVVTGPGTEVEIKVTANRASTGTWNAALIVALCASTSRWQLFELWRSRKLTNI